MGERNSPYKNAIKILSDSSETKKNFALRAQPEIKAAPPPPPLATGRRRSSLNVHGCKMHILVLFG